MSREEYKEQDFSGLGIAPGLLKRIKELGFEHPTPIQFKAIRIATSGEDVVGIAQTGSGKTLAYSIPMLQQISATKKIGLVLLPTRELAVQVEETVKKFGSKFGLRTALVIGGTNPHPQRKQLKAKPHIIIATPGRLIGHMEEKNVSLANVGILILDEADRMLDMGFAPQLKKILADIPKDRQTMLFSATMPNEITAIANQYMKKPLRIEVARSGTTAENINQEVYIVPRAEKLDLLTRILKEYKGSILIFLRTKHAASKLARKVRNMGHSADEIHSNRSQVQRQKALKGFESGKYRILVATDIAARGIDVDDVELVINYDLPEQIEDYVHRIGRTGRAGKSGKAISFAAPEQKNDIVQIQQLIKITLPIKSSTGETLQSIEKSGSSRGTKRNSSRGQRRSTPRRQQSSTSHRKPKPGSSRNDKPKPRSSRDSRDSKNTGSRQKGRITF